MVYKAKFRSNRIKLFSILFVLGWITSFYPQQFHSLDGIESSNGQTILLYRLGTEQYSYNPIFKFNVATDFEEQLMDAHSIIYPVGADIKSVVDFEFFPGDTTNFMNIGDQIYMDYGSYIGRNDSIVFGYHSPFVNVDISKQNPLKVFVFDGGGEIRSWDGGYTFPEDSIYPVTNFIPIALADFDDNVLFGIDEDQRLAKNGGLVDTSLVYFDQYSKFLYDINQFHVYRINLTYGGYSLNVSNNKGDAYTWTKTFQSENPIYVTIDSTQSGVVYLADGRKIYKSVNNGYTFSEYKYLPSKLVGIYKKPNSEILYAATSRKIYKITPDSITVIKSIPVSPEEFNYYPLAIGNYWIYKVTDWSYPYYSEDTFTRKVISKETRSNNKEYFKIEEKYHSSSYTNYVYERVDSPKGIIYRFDSDCSNPDSEKVIDDFTAEVGDSLLIQRFTMCWDSILTLFSETDSESVFNENRNFRTYEYYWLMSYKYKFAQGIGIYNIRVGYDFGETYSFLNGCVIDGNVYGDTTLTDVNDQQNPIPTEFKLEQNYPNPFNPSTSIRYAIASRQFVSLKVYDLLGSEVATLVNEEKPAGNYEVEFNVGASRRLVLTSGIYFYQLKAGDFVETKKMLILK